MKKGRITWIIVVLGFGLLAIWHVRVTLQNTIPKKNNAPPSFAVDIVSNLNDTITIRIRNNSHQYYYIIPSLSFRLGEDSEGYCSSYKSAQHGLFTGYELSSNSDLELAIQVEKSNGSFRYDAIGQEVFPGSLDKVFLDAELKLADFEGGVAYKIFKSCNIGGSLVDVYLSAQDLKVRKESSVFDGGTDKLPEIK